MKLGALEVRIRDATLLCAGIVFALLLLVAPAHAAFPGKNGKIAFDSGRDEPDPITCGSFGRHPCNSEIYTVNPDGTGVARLTNDLALDEAPAWSPEGLKIAFVRDHQQAGDCACGDIFVMNADGSGQTQVTSGIFAYDPAWSPDGKVLFAYRTANATHFATVTPDGTDRNDVVTLSSDSNTGFGDQVWSPDGQEIAYDAEVFEGCDITCGETFFSIRAIAPGGSGDRNLRNGAIQPDWSPDSAQIVLRDADGFDPGASIRAIGRSGNLVRNFNRFGGNPVWSPDGQQVAFVRYTGIFKMNADGSGETQVTSNTTDRRVAEGDLRPDWQPIPGPQRGDYKNAAQFCKAERDFMGDAAFTAKYGGGANAHGKCVSQSH
jgi:Tol biopolymer transport system component